jgi:hypothetical protein
MVHINCERNNVPAMQEVAVALHKACNGSHKLGERNNAPTLKMKKWYGDATVLWVVGKKLAQFTTAGRPNGRVGLAARTPIQSARLFMRQRKYHCCIYC